MASKSDELLALDRELNESESEDDFSSFEAASLIRELKKSVIRGDDEITLILAKAFCEKHMRAQLYPHQECVIYCRVSSEQQAVTNGLLRQLKTNADYARRKDYQIVAIFSEVASGAGPLPVREAVECLAKKRGCLILCEDHTRWSRQGSADVPPAFVIMTAEESALLDKNLRDLLEVHREKILATAG